MAADVPTQGGRPLPCVECQQGREALKARIINVSADVAALRKTLDRLEARSLPSLPSVDDVGGVVYIGVGVVLLALAVREFRRDR